MPSEPIKFSIVMTVYQQPELVLRAMHSVLQQVYDNWELLVYADGPHPSLAAMVYDSAAGVRERVTVVEVERQAGTFGNPLRRRGSQEATGDYLLFLGHDCLLDKDCLLRHADTIVQNGPAPVLSIAQVRHWCSRDYVEPTLPLAVPRYNGIVPTVDFDMSQCLPGAVDLTCVAFPRHVALAVPIFPSTLDTEYTADYSAIMACASRCRAVFVPWITGAHF